MFARLAGYGVISLLLKWFAMDFLQEYESSDSEATDVYNSTNIDVKASDRRASTSVLNVRAVRQVYLITYSQADLHKFPDRNSFAQAVLRSFNSSNTNVEHWVCCKEVHESTGGYHYHMAVKLQRCKRWLSCKRYLEENYGISVYCGGTGGVTTSRFPYPVLLPPVPFCSFVSQLPPFIVFFPSSCKL